MELIDVYARWMDFFKFEMYWSIFYPLSRYFYSEWQKAN